MRKRPCKTRQTHKRLGGINPFRLLPRNFARRSKRQKRPSQQAPLSKPLSTQVSQIVDDRHDGWNRHGLLSLCIVDVRLQLLLIATRCVFASLETLAQGCLGGEMLTLFLIAKGQRIFYPRGSDFGILVPRSDTVESFADGLL